MKSLKSKTTSVLSYFAKMLTLKCVNVMSIYLNAQLFFVYLGIISSEKGFPIHNTTPPFGYHGKLWIHFLRMTKTKPFAIQRFQASRLFSSEDNQSTPFIVQPDNDSSRTPEDELNQAHNISQIFWKENKITGELGQVSSDYLHN